MNFECHITVLLENAEIAQSVADAYNWHTSQIERDPVLGKASYFYLTEHSDNLEELFEEMRECSTALRMRGIKVVREKIEAILYDTKGKT